MTDANANYEGLEEGQKVAGSTLVDRAGVSRAHIMRAFDDLPRIVRNEINNAPVRLDVMELGHVLAEGIDSPAEMARRLHAQGIAIAAEIEVVQPEREETDAGHTRRS